jgi:hypothetical protein
MLIGRAIEDTRPKLIRLKSINGDKCPHACRTELYVGLYMYGITDFKDKNRTNTQIISLNL